MKRFFYIVMLFTVIGGQAAEKPVKYKTVQSEAKTAIKNGSNQANAEKNLLAIVNREDITKNQRADIYFTAGELERSMNKAENMKLYLHQAYDTAKFFSTILKMHEYMLSCDSVEVMQCDESGKIKFRHRNKSRELMLLYRSNLRSGGMFFLKKDKFAEAYPYFDMYLTTAAHPIMEDVATVTGDTLLPRIAYWATLSAYNANQPQSALKYIDRAIAGMTDSVRVSLQEYKVRCYEALGEEEQWVNQLIEGNALYPNHDYFFLHLMDVYEQQKNYDAAIALCDTMLQRVGDRAIYWYGKSQIYLRKQDFEHTIQTANEALRCDSTMIDAYYNKGIAYLNEAIIFAETACNDIRDPKCRQDRLTLQNLYQHAREPLEQMRRLSPDASDRWASPLYRIYLNLNMGKEFSEMEKILNGR